MYRFLRPSMAIVAVVTCSAPALADTTSTAAQAMSVTANVTASCSLDSVPTILLDNLTLKTADASAQTTGAIKVTCTNGTKYDIVIADSASASGGKRMLTATNGTTLSYDLYTTGGTTAYPTVAGTTPAMFTGSGVSDPQDVVLKLDAGQLATAEAGSYTDTVNVTVSY